MKKIFTSALLMMLGIIGMNAQTTLIDFPNSKEGINARGTSVEGTVKIHTNSDAVPCFSLKNGYSSEGVCNGNYISVKTPDGFKAGDVLTIAGVINNKDAAKRATAVLFSVDANNKPTAIYKFQDFINAYSVNDDPVEQSYTLEADMDSIMLGRDGGTQAHLTLIKVVRPESVIVDEPTFVFYDFSDPEFRNPVGESMTDTKGYIYNEVFTLGDVSLQITGGSAPSRVYVDNNRGQCLVTYKEYTTLTFRVPEGKAITEIEFIAAGNSNINNFTASSGTIEGMKWTGNADGVRFQQGGTSYLATAVVKVENKTAETAALAPIEYVECADIAAFNALENGTYAKVTLKDAELTGLSADGYSTMWIQDATGGCWIQYLSIINTKLKESNKVNGFVYVVKRTASGNTQMKEAEDTPDSELTLTDINSYTIVEGTIDEVNVAANLNRVVKISGATLEETSATAGKLTQGESSIDVNNGSETANQQLHKIADWAKDTKLENIDIVAILVAKSASVNQLLPISIEPSVTDGISTVTATAGAADIFNLQGQRLSTVQKGLYIVNGKKVLVK